MRHGVKSLRESWAPRGVRAGTDAGRTWAALTFSESSERYAYRQGLFVLIMDREGLVTLRNDATFRAQDFATGKRIRMVAPREEP